MGVIGPDISGSKSSKMSVLYLFENQKKCSPVSKIKKSRNEKISWGIPNPNGGHSAPPNPQLFCSEQPCGRRRRRRRRRRKYLFSCKKLQFTRGMLARGLSASKLAPSPTHVHDNAQHPYLKNLDIYNLQFLIKIYSYTTKQKNRHPPIPHAQPAHCS